MKPTWRRNAADTEVHTLIGPYALDAVTDIERAAVERHLATCPTCRAEVAELSATAARLGAATVTSPPPGL
ncbi:MAG: zf-HC2 domain-containing protein, partial [Actinocatenispora sp.]